MRKFRLWICPKCLYDFSVYSSTRKVLAGTVLVLLTVAAVPSFTSAQSNAVIQQRFEIMQGEITKLDRVPEDIAIIKVQVQSLQAGMKEQSDSIRYVILSMVAVAAAKFLEVVFGIKVTKREPNEP